MSIHAVSNTLVLCTEESPTTESEPGTLRVKNGQAAFHNGLYWGHFPDTSEVVAWCIHYARQASKTLYFRIVETIQ